MRRGEVYSVGRRRFVVITADEHNTISPQGLEITRGGADYFPYSLALIESDPISGFVMTDHVHTLAGEPVEGPVCLLSGASVARLSQALRELYDLPGG